MKTYVTILDTTDGHNELKKLLPDLKDVFELKEELKIKEIELVLDPHGKEYEAYYPIQKSKCVRYGTIKQLVTTDDDKHFSRELIIRIDDTHHNNYDLHINLNLIDRYIDAADWTKTHELGEYHLKYVKPLTEGMLYVSMRIPGKALMLPVVCLVDIDDLEYHKKQQEFFRKLRDGKLSVEDELEFEKVFNSYSKIIRKRKGIE